MGKERTLLSAAVGGRATFPFTFSSKDAPPLSSVLWRTGWEPRRWTILPLQEDHDFAHPVAKNATRPGHPEVLFVERAGQPPGPEPEDEMR